MLIELTVYLVFKLSKFKLKLGNFHWLYTKSGEYLRLPQEHCCSVRLQLYEMCSTARKSISPEKRRNSEFENTSYTLILSQFETEQWAKTFDLYLFTFATAIFQLFSKLAVTEMQWNEKSRFVT